MTRTLRKSTGSVNTSGFSCGGTQEPTHRDSRELPQLSYQSERFLSAKRTEIPKKIRDKIFFFAIIYLTWTQDFESTFANEVLLTSGQLPNSLGAPQVVRTPATLQHCHSTSMTALVSIVSQHTLDV